jgi:putative glutamine amidotransferase
MTLDPGTRGDARERPLIAIDGELLTERAPSVTLPTRYAEAVHRAGGFPLVLPPIGGEAFVDELVARVDGLLLAGGDDFETEPLGLGPTHPAAKPVPAEKQAFDLLLARTALAHGIPTLGVCYGMQLLALGEGGDLFQHLPDDLPDAQEHAGGVRHAVRLEPGSKLARLLGVAEVDVISRHHQALARTGPAWTVCGVDAEGLIEAVERSDHPFALGVQWHPELGLDDPLQTRLFEGLVRAAAEHRAQRTTASTACTERMAT